VFHRQRIFILIAFVVLSAGSLFAQGDRSTEFFVGYTNLQGEGLPDQNDPDNILSNDFLNRRTTLHGANAAVTFFPLEMFGLTGDVSFSRNSNDVDVTGGSNDQDTDIWYFMAGPTFSLPSSSRFQPFGRIMAGGAHTAFKLEQERTVGSGTVRNSFDVGSTDFAMGIGGGLDVTVNDRLKVRLIQVDYTPIFLGDRAINVLGNAGVLQPLQSLQPGPQSGCRHHL
jgi:opacity protein-like surface antigen